MNAYNCLHQEFYVNMNSLTCHCTKQLLQVNWNSILLWNKWSWRSCMPNKKQWRKNKPNLALEVTIQISLAKKPSSIGLQKWNQRCHYHSIPKINSNFGPEDNFHLPMEKPSSSGNCSATNTPYWKSTPIFLLKWN